MKQRNTGGEIEHLLTFGDKLCIRRADIVAVVSRRHGCIIHVRNPGTSPIKIDSSFWTVVMALKNPGKEGTYSEDMGEQKFTPPEIPDGEA